MNNPRGLSFGPNGALYVAESGKGGSGPCVPSPEGGQSCYGDTGSITRIWKGNQERIVTGLPSLAGQGGVQAIGPADISVHGNWADILVGFGGDPNNRSQLGDAGANFGQLVKLNLANGKWMNAVDVSAYEVEANPEPTHVDSNPYSLVSWPNKAIVSDAGGNDLLQVDSDGNISTLGIFFPRTGEFHGQTVKYESVPDSVTVGPDGAYYVGELTGGPFIPGVARVWRVVPGEKPTVFASGFTNIIDLAFGPDGSLYVLEIFKNGLSNVNPQDPSTLAGALYRIAPDGSRTLVASDGLVAPGGLAIDKDGSIYISNFSILAGQGQVVKLNSVPGMPPTGGGGTAHNSGLPFAPIYLLVPLAAITGYSVLRLRRDRKAL